MKILSNIKTGSTFVTSTYYEDCFQMISNLYNRGSAGKIWSLKLLLNFKEVIMYIQPRVIFCVPSVYFVYNLLKITDYQDCTKFHSGLNIHHYFLKNQKVSEIKSFQHFLRYKAKVNSIVAGSQGCCCLLRVTLSTKNLNFSTVRWR